MDVQDPVGQVPSAFLSHASEDKASFAEPLGRALADLGVQPWLDKWEIRPGDSLVRRLFDEGLARADAVIVVVSAVSATKPWVREELDAATVRRITDGIRLIPVRLDDAEMPAPLAHLLWLNSERTPEAIERVAGSIADTLHGQDPRPTVAAPPAYVTSTVAAVPGLTRADTFLLAETVREALENRVLFGLNWPAVEARVRQSGLSEAAVEESREALVQRRLVEVNMNGDWVVQYGLTRYGYAAGIGAVLPDIGEMHRRAVAILVNDRPSGEQAIDELAERAAAPRLVVDQLLQGLEDRNLVDVIRSIGGSRIPRVSPTLRRELT